MMTERQQIQLVVSFVAEAHRATAVAAHQVLTKRDASEITDAEIDAYANALTCELTALEALQALGDPTRGSPSS